MQYDNTLHNLTINAVEQPDGTFNINCNYHELQEINKAIKSLHQRRKYSKENYYKHKPTACPRSSLGLSLNVVR